MFFPQTTPTGATMTFLHIPAFLHRAPVAAENSTTTRLGWLDRLAQWSDRQPARPHHMGSYIV